MSRIEKGIILAGGAGTRLWPVTKAGTKQLLPVYDKPMVYYPLTTLMLAGIRQVLVIGTEPEIPRFRALLDDGRQWGMRFQYAVQAVPDGIAKAFVVGEDFIAGDSCALILGDNVFYGAGLAQMLQRTAERASGATVFCHWVTDPRQYGVVELDARGRPRSIKEKPENPRSNWAVTGLYFYDETIGKVVRNLRPSQRGELEITDANKVYLEEGTLHVEKLGRGFAWFDAGTHRSLLQASDFIHTVEERQGLKIGCPEEVAYRMGFITAGDLRDLAKTAGSEEYCGYLQRLLTTSA